MLKTVGLALIFRVLSKTRSIIHMGLEWCQYASTPSFEILGKKISKTDIKATHPHFSFQETSKLGLIRVRNLTRRDRRKGHAPFPPHSTSSLLYNLVGFRHTSGRFPKNALLCKLTCQLQPTLEMEDFATMLCAKCISKYGVRPCISSDRRDPLNLRGIRVSWMPW